MNELVALILVAAEAGDLAQVRSLARALGELLATTTRARGPLSPAQRKANARARARGQPEPFQSRNVTLDYVASVTKNVTDRDTSAPRASDQRSLLPSVSSLDLKTSKALKKAEGGLGGDGLSRKVTKNVTPPVTKNVTPPPYDAALLRDVHEALALTRRSGKMADAVWQVFLRKCGKHPVDVVERSMRVYLDRWADAEKDERYLLGIIHGEARAIGRTLPMLGLHAVPALPTPDVSPELVDARRRLAVVRERIAELQCSRSRSVELEEASAEQTRIVDEIRAIKARKPAEASA